MRGLKKLGAFRGLCTLLYCQLLLIFQIDAKNIENDKVLRKLRDERGYSYEDEITCSKECLPNYDEKVINITR